MNNANATRADADSRTSVIPCDGFRPHAGPKAQPVGLALKLGYLYGEALSRVWPMVRKALEVFHG